MVFGFGVAFGLECYILVFQGFVLSFWVCLWAYLMLGLVFGIFYTFIWSGSVCVYCDFLCLETCDSRLGGVLTL